MLALALILLAAQPIFDGSRRSYAEWRSDGGARVVRSGDLLRTRPGNGLGVLWYARRPYRNFELRLDVRMSAGANSGIHLRFPSPRRTSCAAPSWVTCGYEVQLNDTGPDPRRTGSIYGFADLDAAGARVVRPGRWSSFRIRVVGQRYTVWRDGVRINRFKGSRRATGYIGLQAHGGPQDVVWFRNIRVRVL